MVNQICTTNLSNVAKKVNNWTTIRHLTPTFLFHSVKKDQITHPSFISADIFKSGGILKRFNKVNFLISLDQNSYLACKLINGNNLILIGWSTRN